MPVRLTGVAPIAKAISTAGGIAFDEIDAQFMLLRRPGVFVAGEMLDWEAPTGGYLLQACFATGGGRARRGRWLNAWNVPLESEYLSAKPTSARRSVAWPLRAALSLKKRSSISEWMRCIHFSARRGALLIVPDVALQLRDAIFRRAQLQRQLVRDVHGAFAILLGDVDRFLQHRDDAHGRSGRADRRHLPLIAGRRRERNDFFGGCAGSWHTLHSTDMH